MVKNAKEIEPKAQDTEALLKENERQIVKAERTVEEKRRKLALAARITQNLCCDSQ